ncbi:MAG: low molecular weight phosphatase family protein [Acidobacteria bacterium]|jgi:arsenate reductase|nr:low molecular weight phosphatase family protein [Acidobacteriota bacterium]
MVLFICVGNTCRSPMAEAMARSLSGGRLEALSAGISPTGRIASGTRRALTTLGYSHRELRSKGLGEVPLEEVDLVVSLIGREGLRWLPLNLAAGSRVWSISDPFGEDDETYLAIARMIEGRVRELVDELV